MLGMTMVLFYHCVFYGICFQVLFTLCLIWLLCYILTLTDVFPKDPTKNGFHARTDTRSEVLDSAEWFRVPYPCKFMVQNSFSM